MIYYICEKDSLGNFIEKGQFTFIPDSVNISEYSNIPNNVNISKYSNVSEDIKKELGGKPVDKVEIDNVPTKKTFNLDEFVKKLNLSVINNNKDPPYLDIKKENEITTYNLNNLSKNFLEK